MVALLEFILRKYRLGAASFTADTNLSNYTVGSVLAR